LTMGRGLLFFIIIAKAITIVSLPIPSCSSAIVTVSKKIASLTNLPINPDNLIPAFTEAIKAARPKKFGNVQKLRHHDVTDAI